MTEHGDEQPRVPTEAWLRGYFYRHPDDVIDTDEPVGEMWKNVDFLRLRDAALHLLDPRPGRTILDIGCAEGATMIYCGLQGAIVYGQDLDATAVSEANRLLARYGLTGEARVGDALDLGTFDAGSMDGVIASDFFEHITDSQKITVLREAWRVLRPGGIVVLKTPNLSYLRASLLFKRLRAVSRLRDPSRVVIPHTRPTGESGHIEHVGLTTRWRLAHCLREARFLNYQFVHPPLKRFGSSVLMEVLSSEVPIARDWLCEDLIVRAYKPIALAHFPD